MVPGTFKLNVAVILLGVHMPRRGSKLARNADLDLLH